MKKFLSLCLALVMVLSLAACGEDKKAAKGDEEGQKASVSTPADSSGDSSIAEDVKKGEKDTNNKPSMKDAEPKGEFADHQPKDSEPAKSEAPDSSEESDSSQEPDVGTPAEGDLVAVESVGEGDVGPHHVSIKSARLTEDEGKPVVIVTYEWTNGAEESTSSYIALLTTAYQDGIELDIAFPDDEDYDGSGDMKDVRPGTTIEIERAYEMTSEDSVIEYEIKEFLKQGTGVVTAEFDPATLK